MMVLQMVLQNVLNMMLLSISSLSKYSNKLYSQKENKYNILFIFLINKDMEVTVEPPIIDLTHEVEVIDVKSFQVINFCKYTKMMEQNICGIAIDNYETLQKKD